MDRMGPHRVRFSFDGTPLEAPRGLTIAGALLANGIVSWRWTGDGRARGIFCGAGVCFDCLVDVGERQAVRACLVRVRDGDEVWTSAPGRGAG
jgi:predicted molibdopterin-dependent oxidoreductase YjgC